MLARLLFLFISVPLVELALLLFVAKHTSVLFTISLVVVTGIVGATLARRQGFRAYQRIQQDLSAGQMPKDALVDTVMIFVAGALLLTPGVLTDMFGLSLLVPRCRRFYQGAAVRWFRANVTVVTSSAGTHTSRDEIIDSYVVEQEKPDEEE